MVMLPHMPPVDDSHRHILMNIADVAATSAAGALFFNSLDADLKLLAAFLVVVFLGLGCWVRIQRILRNNADRDGRPWSGHSDGE